ncbi:MAG: PEP-CTERM sorting domain-containing protein [Akkermansia sp.]|nr:PEP-CTERM sorting domain-containing protein [Akkermansia sp.]
MEIKLVGVIAASCLVGTAFAETAWNGFHHQETFEIEWNGTNKHDNGNDNDGNHLSLSDFSLTLYEAGQKVETEQSYMNGSLDGKSDLGYGEMDLRPNLALTGETGKSNSWVLSYTLTNKSDHTIYFDSFRLTVFAFTGTGSDAKTIQFPYTVTYTAGVILGETELFHKDVTGHITAVNNAGSSGPTADSIRPGLFVLNSSESATIFVEMKEFAPFTSAGSSEPVYVGVKEIEIGGYVDVVPEPTTATLSLLALAGLAARRRRK